MHHLDSAPRFELSEKFAPRLVAASLLAVCLAVAGCGASDSPKSDSRSEGAPAPSSSTASSEKAGVDLLARIELPRDQVQGECRLEDGALVIRAEQAAYLEAPVDLPEHYMLDMQVQRLQGDGSLNVGLVVGPSQVMSVVEGWRNRQHGLSLVGGVPGNQNRTTTTRQIFQGASAKVRLRYVVSPNEVTVLYNGDVVTQWKGDPQELSLDVNTFPPRTPRRLMIGGWGATLRVSEARLIEMSP